MWGMRKQKRSRGTPGPLALVSSRSLEGGEPRGGGGAPGGFQVERQDSMISRQLQAGFESRGRWRCPPVSAVSTGLRVPGMEGQLAGKRRK